MPCAHEDDSSPYASAMFDVWSISIIRLKKLCFFAILNEGMEGVYRLAINGLIFLLISD